MMASISGTLYVGMTNNLKRRVHQHKTGYNEGFTKKYGCHKLVWFEEHEYVFNTISREKQLKRWSRRKKEYLIREVNPQWKDLAEGWDEEDTKCCFETKPL